jgi:hypothetical protein
MRAAVSMDKDDEPELGEGAGRAVHDGGRRSVPVG